MTGSEIVVRRERGEPLPQGMQGRWVAEDEPATELIIQGGDIVCFGEPVDYDFKEEGSHVDGSITVSLRVNNKAEEDSFQRANITELVITPEGEFFAYNVKSACQFVRPIA